MANDLAVIETFVVQKQIWIPRWGDRNMNEFIENIPYNETRNYIKKVMGSYYFYQMLYK